MLMPSVWIAASFASDTLLIPTMIGIDCGGTGKPVTPL
jgi:hypothetical protein